MRERLFTDPSAKMTGSVLSGPIFSGSVNRARSGSECYPIGIVQFNSNVHLARFVVPFANLLEPRSKDW
jgi:hypothetical protein